MDTAMFVRRSLFGSLLIVGALQAVDAPPAAAQTREYRFAVDGENRVTAERDGPLPSFIANRALSDEMLQSIASFYRVDLAMHCEDPLADTRQRAFKENAVTLAKAVDAVMGKTYTFTYRDGANRTVDAPSEAAYASAFALDKRRRDEQIASVDAFPPGCGPQGPVARRYFGNTEDPVLARQTPSQTPEKTPEQAGQPPVSGKAEQPPPRRERAQRPPAGDDAAPPTLSSEQVAAVMANDGPYSRVKAMRALRLSKDPKAVADAERGLNDPSSRVMLEAARALVSLSKRGGTEADAARKLAERFKRDPILDLVLLAAPLDQDASWPMIKELTETSDKQANSTAIRALSLGVDPRGIPWLKSVVLNGERYDAQQAALVIGKMGGPAGVGALADLLSTSGSTDRAPLVLEGIATLNSADREKIEGVLAQRVAQGATTPAMDEALARRGYLEPLTSLLADPNAAVDLKVKTLTAMANAGNNTAIDGMAAALSDPRPEVRRIAVESIARVGSDDAIAPLTQSMSDKDADVRATAAYALRWYVADDEVLQSIVPLLRDPSERVRKSAMEALAMSGPPGDFMKGVLKTARDSSDPYVAKRADELIKRWQVE